MANLVIEDLYAQMSVMVFPGVLERLNFVLQPDALVLIKGRISIREDEEPTILVDDARIWEPDREQAEEKEKNRPAPPIPGLPSGDELPLYGMEKQAQSKQEEPQQTLWLKLKSFDNEFMLTGLLAMLKRYPGPHCVKVYAADSKKLVKLHDMVAFEKDLMEKLTLLLGKENVKITQK